MSTEERQRWDAHFLEVDNAPPVADPFIERLADGSIPLPERRVALDLPCGRGRHALWLAERGWDVYGCDVSMEGLRIARRYSSARGQQLRLFCAELDEYPLPEDRFDLIVVFFFLKRELFPAIHAALRPGGLLMYRTYVDSAEERSRRAARAAQGQSAEASHPSFTLDPGELSREFAELEILHYAEKTNERTVAEFIGRKRLTSSA